MEPQYDTDKNKIYNVVEQMPEYPGGQAALLKFIGDNLKYPKRNGWLFSRKDSE